MLIKNTDKIVVKICKMLLLSNSNNDIAGNRTITKFVRKRQVIKICMTLDEETYYIFLHYTLNFSKSAT